MASIITLNNAHVVNSTNQIGTVTHQLNNAPSGIKPYAINVVEVTLSHCFHNVYTGTKMSPGFGEVPRNTVSFSFAGNDYVLNIPEGQYTTDQLVSTMNTLFDSAVGAGIIVVSIAPWTESTNPFDGKLKVTNTVGVSDFKITNKVNNIAGAPESYLFKQLGLRGGVNTEFVVSTFADSIMNDQVDLGGPRVVYIHSNTLSKGNSIDSLGNRTNIIESVSLADVPYGGAAHKQINDRHTNMIYYQNSEHLTKIDLYLTDGENNKLNLPHNATFDIKIRSYHGESSANRSSV